MFSSTLSALKPVEQRDMLTYVYTNKYRFDYGFLHFEVVVLIKSFERWHLQVLNELHITLNYTTII